MSDAEKKGDATRIGGGPPAAPKLPSSGAPSGGSAEHTHPSGAPPVMPAKPPSAPPPAQPPLVSPPPAPSPDEGDGGETVIVGQVAQRAKCSLQRVQPPGHAEVIYLSGETYLAGRKHGADLPLFSPTASREHARLERRADGWYLEPIEGKAVIANGSLLRGAIRLEHKTRLQMGGDELIFFDEAVAVAAAPVRAATPASSRSGRGRWIVVAVAVAVAAVALAWWVLSSTR